MYEYVNILNVYSYLICIIHASEVNAFTLSRCREAEVSEECNWWN
jgi:hypothetical protein